MGHLRNDKAYSGNTRLKKSRKVGQKQTPQEFCGDLFITGGWGGIRTPGGVASTAVFKTVAFDRSATHPKLFFRRSFQPAVLFAFRTCRCCSPLVRARPQYFCLAYSYARPSHSTVLPPILNLISLDYFILFFFNCNTKYYQTRNKHYTR